MSSIPDFGEKFIGVDAGGTFECHGKKTLAWTKLTGTISGFNALTLDFRHKVLYGSMRMYISCMSVCLYVCMHVHLCMEGEDNDE